MLPHFPITIMPGRCKEEEERRRASKKRGGRRKARIVAKKSGERREDRGDAITPASLNGSIENARVARICCSKLPIITYPQQ
mmetsp:Transcript_40142/g.104061  ORF Transcript_40142/g.104061 Transcript_40142/m.104061 type:complete len:82 (-) Transcript_40142:149-394(-)